MKLSYRHTLLVGSLAWLGAGRVFAHHAMAGEMPVTTMQGLLSGLAHPVIGMDHLAFLLLVGTAAIFSPRPRMTPLMFVGSTVIGCLAFLSGWRLPGLEIGVAASVLMVGIMVLSGRQYAPTLYLVLFASAGLLHGAAYGEAIVGSPVPPLLAYLLGFACIQYAITLGVGSVLRGVSRSGTAGALHPRLAGALAAGVGLALFIEHIELALAV